MVCYYIKMDRRIWVGGALCITGLFGLLYVAVHQSLRLSANDPQVSMAYDTAAVLRQHRHPAGLVQGRVDADHSMAPFVIVYDAYGNAIAGNGYIEGAIPAIPLDLLQHTPSNGRYHAVTWEPAQGVRIALVSVKTDGYCVVSGRSLTAVEDRITNFTQLLASTWLITICVIAAIGFLVTRQGRISTP